MQPISADAVLQEFRNKVTGNIVWFIAGTTLLLAAVQGWMGHWWQTLMILVAGAIAAAVAWQYRGQRIPTPWRVVLMVVLVSITVMSIEKNGSLGVYWSYPLLITAFFMFRGVLAVLVGAVIGDQMLKQLAERLKRSIRSTDKLFRVGGEEFMVVMPETTLTQALAAAEKLRHAVAEKPFAGKDATVSLTVSLGVAELAAEMTWSQWINQADTALLEAKKQGRNQVSQVPTGMPTHDRI
ncbi:GGDEF domain-containing protein [Pseudidiomarina sp. PP-1MA]|uniref:diguanylate cyclase n=1 Tax=Pseudidiomarina sp. PP-1MA TaxID=3237706 RepID=A0AB39X6H5_9GAMM